MDTTIIQVPVSKDLRKQATEASEKLGFSSLQETVRVFLNQLAKKEIDIAFQTKTYPLSPANELRYTKMVKDVESGKVKTKKFVKAEDLMQHLSE